MENTKQQYHSDGKNYISQEIDKGKKYLQIVPLTYHTA